MKEEVIVANTPEHCIANARRTPLRGGLFSANP
jgi:hypothetical protein